MRLVTGDECGLLKEVMPELGRRKKDPNALIQPHSAMMDVTKEGVARIDPKEIQKRERSVIDMVWMDEGSDNIESEGSYSSFGVLRKNGCVDVWTTDIEKKKSFGRYSFLYSTSNNIFGSIERPRPLGIGFFPQQNRLCAGDMMGNIVVLDYQKNKCDVVRTYNSYATSKGRKTISYTPGKQENVHLATAMAFDTVRGRSAVGGREREVCLTDIATGKIVYKTKNMPPDPQTLLQQPVWPTAIQFLNQESNLLAVGTAYKQVRLYDVRESSKIRRPTSLTPEGLLEYRITCLCQIDEHELAVGDASGDILTIDLRRLARNSKAPANRDLARYPGPAGSVRQLKKHPTLPRLAAVGLDRMLRVYDTKTRKQLDCVYLKQRLNCVLCHHHKWDSSDDTSVVSEKNDYDFAKIDDMDIDQDDVVEDYIDSDGSDSDNDVQSDNQDEGSSQSASEESTYADDNDDVDDNDTEDDHDYVNNDNDNCGSDGSSPKGESSDEISSEEETRATKNRKKKRKIK